MTCRSLCSLYMKYTENHRERERKRHIIYIYIICLKMWICRWWKRSVWANAGDVAWYMPECCQLQKQLRFLGSGVLCHLPTSRGFFSIVPKAWGFIMTVFSCIFYVACHTACFSSNTQTHPRTARGESSWRIAPEPVGTSSFLCLLICNAVGYINDHLYLVGGWSMFFMTFHSVGIFIIPTDELHHFSEG